MSESSIGNAETDEEEHPWPHIESMFTLVKMRNSSYIMRCLLCQPKQTEISAFKNSTSNLRKHVARVHPNKLSKYTDLVENHRKRKSSSSSDTAVKNARIQTFAAPGRVTQAKLDRMVLNFVCEANQPFSVVETPSFKTLIETLQPHSVMTRKTLCTRIEEAAKHKKSMIIKKLSAVNYVATTTDCWSARQRSYLGVTCHWIDPNSLERHSAALACRPVKGSHTFDVLAAALEQIHSEYHIREKVTRTTTDSGSNFLKAFRLYGEEKEEAASNQEESDSILDDETEDQSESEVEYQDVSAILDDNTGLEYQLPRHQKCACHLLNLVSTVDTNAAGGTTNENYKRLSRSSFAKCHALWNKTSRSTMAHETVERECKLQFLRPNQTCWSSLFLAVERIVRIHREQGEQAIRNVCTALKIKTFHPAEMGFLSEYAAVMSRAMALNILQGESSVHMGLLLPTLYQLQDKLKRLESLSKICTPLVHALQQGIQKRFGDIMKEPELIAAAILLPRFRTSWTTEENILNAGLDYIRNHLDTDLDDVPSTNGSLSDEDDFFASMELGKSQVGELERYLSCLSPAGMDLLHTFPHIKKLSLKVNTGLPASAACERLFSHAGLLFTAKRSQLNSKNLESQLLLKLNRDITE